jgi:hypothetical protein
LVKIDILDEALRKRAMKAGLRFWNLVAALTLAASPVLAADRAHPDNRSRPAPGGPLKPGKSAGVQAAQQSRTGLALIGAGGVIAVVLIATQGGGNANQPNFQSAPATTTP